MIIKRVGKKDNYKYVDGKDNEIKDPDILEYIKKLVIPPNYADVVIFYEKKGVPKILYQGYDSKNRLQQIYSAAWVKKSAKKKFCQLLDLANSLEAMNKDIDANITSEENTKEKMISLVLKIMMICYFRIGNRKYQDLYGSAGAMTLKKKHITLKNGVMHISFLGKKGVLNTCTVEDKKLVDIIKDIMGKRSDDESIFQWADHGVKVPLRATDVNDWLKSFNQNITSKDFRTYDANVLLIIYLRSQPDPTKSTKAQRKKIIVAALKEISSKIHNTPAILKKNYTQSGIIDMYMDQPVRFKRYFMNDKSPKESFIDYLKDYCD